MKHLDPDRLTQVRAARGLSRERLAKASHVSVRQMARIEAAEEPVEVRETTMSRLAAALEVDTAVLAGEAPLPANLDVPEIKPTKILPEVLAKLRKSLGWSRRELAKKARVSSQLIERIEGKAEPVSVKPLTSARLAQALTPLLGDVDVSESQQREVLESYLRGEKPLESAPPTPEHSSITVRSAPGLRLAYDLVRERYGAGPKDLFVLAPALFVLLAEGSLDRRRRKLEEAREASRSLDELGRDNATLFFAKGCYQQAFDWGMGIEEASIRKGDVLGRDVWDGSGMDMWGFSEDDMTVTPFAEYLEELAGKVDRPDVLRFGDGLLPHQGLDVWGANPYAVCGGDLDEIAGGSRHARWALEWGNVRISDIPEELRSEEAKDRRASWLASKLDEDVKDRMERHEAFLQELEALVLEGAVREGE